MNNNDRLPSLPARRAKTKSAAKTPPVARERFTKAESAKIKKEIAARIVEIFGDNDADIARRCLTTGATIAKYTKGERIPTGEILLQMRRVAGVNIHWLLTGEGRRYVVEDVKTHLTDAETDLIGELAQASGRDFIGMLTALAAAMAGAQKRLEK